MREIVNELTRTASSFGNADVAAQTGTTRQAVHRQLNELVRTGLLVRQGRGRATRYRLANAAPPGPRFERTYDMEGLREDEVWQELRDALTEPLSRPSARNAEALTAYALTEMVNNAIDHSGAGTVTVRASHDAAPDNRDTGDTLWFEVRDAGRGAFENVRAALGLPDQLAALLEITKGKLTTQPDRHSGEGLFFTSKMADHFELEANGLCWIVDNRRADQAIGSAAERPGTTVRFAVSANKSMRPEEVFARYTHDFEFDTTRTVVKLFEYSVRFVSRSEAKRLVDGLERFRHVILDFAGVEAVGQGFADEVFRIWARAHPEIELVAENMAPPVAFMVRRSQSVPAPRAP